MGRHSRGEPPDEGPAAGSPGSGYRLDRAPAGPPYDAFSGPTDDRVYVSPHEQISTGPPAGAPRQHGPPRQQLFEPLPGDYPGDYPGAPGPYSAAAPERPPDGPFERPLERPFEQPGPDPEGELDAESRPERSGLRRWFGFLSVLPVPLMPILALVVAVGIVSYALSTQQISLNFAGGTPNDSQTEQRDNQITERGPGERAGRGAERSDGLVVAFRVASRTSEGFTATATIANRGPRPVGRWALAFKIDTAAVTTVSGATAVRTGATPFLRGRTAIAPGGKVRIVFTARGAAARPSSCVLNSKPCEIV